MALLGKGINKDSIIIDSNDQNNNILKFGIVKFISKKL